jgi:hypothetical protein
MPAPCTGTNMFHTVTYGTFGTLLSFLALSFSIGILIIFMSAPGMEDFLTARATNTSITNQTFTNNISLAQEQNISAGFPFESNYVEVLGSQIAL